MAKLLREAAWRDLREGDVFRVRGIRGRRFRFVAHVTNFENGATHIDAVDVTDGSFRAFGMDRHLVKVRSPVR